MYHMAPDQVTRFRERVAADGTGVPIGELVEAARARGIDVTAHDVLKTVPKGFPKDHPRADLLRLKGLVTWRQWPAGAWLGTAKAKTRIVEFLREVQPINDWLDANVGPSDAPPDRRS
jgi:uncharacterized protein (DUF2461 family)